MTDDLPAEVAADGPDMERRHLVCRRAARVVLQSAEAAALGGSADLARRLIVAAQEVLALDAREEQMLTTEVRALAADRACRALDMTLDLVERHALLRIIGPTWIPARNEPTGSRS